MRSERAGDREDLTPRDHNVRSIVHEYGGGDYAWWGDTLVYTALGVPGIQRLGGDPVPGTLDDARYADFGGSPDGRWLLAIEERKEGGKEPRNRLVAFDVNEGRRVVVVEQHDFVSTGRFSPAGDAVACIAWDHPNMPWDGTVLLRIGWASSGPAGTPERVAGGKAESIVQPGWSGDGHLTWSSDRSGFWNLEQWRDGQRVAPYPREAELGSPHWVFGTTNWVPGPGGTLVVHGADASGAFLGRLDPARGALDPIDVPFNEIVGIDAEGERVVVLGVGAAAPLSVAVVEPSGAIETRARAFDLPCDADSLSAPEAITFPSADGRHAHAFLYRPTHARYAGQAGERPPLVVKSHGGPTAASGPGLKLNIQYWTSRGFAVVDVNYGGSSGYGRAYRELLRERWGIVDVEDCCAAAEHLAAEGIADAERLAITGGSAGGYTTLASLAFKDTFRAGASHYGIGDLEALARDTHKFEARYLDSLIGPYPEMEARYRERSPIHHSEGLSCPVIFFQGSEDKVVPPNQAEAMVAALAERGIPHAYRLFEGEAHGFRRAENIRAALEGELWFYGAVFGFAVDAQPDPPIELRGS